jgi:hypothetical protein
MQTTWDLIASAAAAHALERLAEPRGAMPWLPHDLVAAAFGVDGPVSDERVQGTVQTLRKRLPTLGLAELGFGVSPDGRAWALLVQAIASPGSTDTGNALRAELLVPILENAVREAWHAAGGR